MFKVGKTRNSPDFVRIFDKAMELARQEMDRMMFQSYLQRFQAQFAVGNNVRYALNAKGTGDDEKAQAVPQKDKNPNNERADVGVAQDMKVRVAQRSRLYQLVKSSYPLADFNELMSYVEKKHDNAEIQYMIKHPKMLIILLDAYSGNTN